MEILIFLLFFVIGFIAWLIDLIKKNDKIYVIVVIVLVGVLGGILLVNLNIDDNGGSAAGDGGFTIENYNIVLDVHEDNVVDVTENIAVNWYNTNHHGILKFVPYWLPYTGRDGKTVKRKSNIDDLRAVGDSYSIDSVKRKERIKIGSADSFVSYGEKNYVIKYTYDMGNDPFNGFDEFIFYAFGDYWGTDIKNATLEINMPKSIEGYNINFFLDKYRKRNANNIVDYEVYGNKIYAKFNASKNGNVELKKALTVDIELPQGYFNGGSDNYGKIALVLIGIIVLITLFILYTWYKYGKDYPKRAKTVEFYPPDSLSSAEIGYVYNKKYNKKLVISLIIELASKGYIKIDEVVDKRRKKISITNLVPRPSNITSHDSFVPKREINIAKVKNSDDNLSTDAKTMMAYLFKSGYDKKLDSNIDKFLEVRDELVNGGYIRINSDNESLIPVKEEEYKKLIKDKDLENEKYENEFDKMPKMSSYEKMVYEALFSHDNSVKNVILSEHTTFYTVFSKIDDLLNEEFNKKINDNIATKKMHLAMKLNIAMIILYFISYLVEDLNPNYNNLYLVPAICISFSMILIYLIKRRTDYGEIIYARVMGFRDFLIKVEKDNLEALVEKDPKYFYNILPFTYVLGISKKWVKKFEDIPMPNVDMGNFDYGSEGSFYSIYDDVYVPTPTYSSSSGGGSGCSSCGGGCSSCGGGCSSCGGGGSW